MSLELESGAILKRVEDCIRCSMIKIDQTDGGDNDALYTTMANHPENKFTFGALFEVGDETISTTIRVGENIGIISKDPTKK